MAEDKKVVPPPTEEFEIVETPVEYEPGEDDKKVSLSSDRDEDDDDEVEDKRVDAESAHESEPRQSKRREQREKEKARRAAAIERDKSLINQLAEQNRLLSERLSQVEAGATNLQVQSITSKMDQLASVYRGLEAKKAEAIRLGDGDAVVRIDKEMSGYSAEWHKLNGQKTQMTPSVEQQVQQQRPAQTPVSERAKSLAEDFMKQNSWIDLESDDRDSRIVKEIDVELAREGMNPNTRAYWDEFNERLREALPNRFKSQGRRTSPPVGSGREGVSSATKTQVYVSKERRQAMEEAGVWDDPVKRKAQLAYYADFDRRNGVSR